MSFFIHKINPTKPRCVTLGIQDSTIKFEIDTGSGIILISEREYCMHFQNLQLTGTKIKVITYANQPLKVLGKLIINVSYENKIYNRLPLYVIKGSGVNLLGRNWMTLMRLNWENIFEKLQGHNPDKEKVNCVNIQKELEAVTNKYPNVFSEKLGTIKGVQAKINVIPNSKPKFMKARTVPFAMKAAVELEIERMENEGILKSVPFSKWARRIAIVPKSDDRLRICGDYKQTVNPCLDDDIFPQPTPEELFSKIHVRKKFSKIDLSQAYLQMQLEEQLQKYLTINTSKGLKQYTRMPYGVKPASGIFQRFIVVKIDDILITGKNDEEHLKNIEKVLEVLNQVGATVNKS